MAKEKNPNTSFQDLREKREESGFSLKDVFRQTRISVAYLEAIENGDFHLLPLPIYARNFINTYAVFLGLDSKLILARYENYLSSLNILENIPPGDLLEEKATFLEVISRHSTIMGIASFVVVIVCVIWLISMQYKPTPEEMAKNSKKDSAVDISASIGSTTGQETNTIASITEKTTANLTPAVNGSDKQPQPPSPSQKDTSEEASTQQPEYKEPSRLIIRATEETWIRIKADKKHSFQVLLKPGEKVEYKAAIFDMDIGNAGGVKIQFQGKAIENLGNSGEAIHLRLP